VQWLLGLAVSLAALALAFRNVDLAEMIQALRTANYVYVAPALALIYLGQHARALSWHTILGRTVPYRRVFDALNEGYLLNNVLPFRLGELGRAYLVSRGQSFTTARALSSVLVERVVDLCMIVGMLAAFIPTVAGLAWARGTAIVSVVITVVALVGVFVLARSRAWILPLARWGLKYITWLNTAHWETRIDAFIEGMSALQDGGRFLFAALCSAGAWAAAGLGASVLLRAFLPATPFLELLSMGFFVLIITGLAIAAPSAPANVGVWEAGVVGALTVFQTDRTLAVSYAVLFHLVTFALTSTLGFLALSREGETLTHLAQAAQSLISGGRAAATEPAETSLG
jgi:uncharacterized protein (TIRG00374 family)